MHTYLSPERRNIERIPGVRLPVIAKSIRIINNYDNYMHNKLSPIIRQSRQDRWQSVNQVEEQKIFTAIDFTQPKSLSSSRSVPYLLAEQRSNNSLPKKRLSPGKFFKQTNQYQDISDVDTVSQISSIASIKQYVKRTNRTPVKALKSLNSPKKQIQVILSRNRLPDLTAFNEPKATYKVSSRNSSPFKQKTKRSLKRKHGKDYVDLKYSGNNKATETSHVSDDWCESDEDVV